MRVQMGLPPPGLHPPPGAAGPIAPAGSTGLGGNGGRSWKVAGEVICDVGVPLPAGAVTLGGSKALVPINTGAVYVKQVPKSKIGTMDVKDLRILPLRFDEQGQRRRSSAKQLLA